MSYARPWLFRSNMHAFRACAHQRALRKASLHLRSTLQTHRCAATASYEELKRSWREKTRSLYTFFDEPLLITKAEKATLTDHNGKTYLDFYNNVHQIGHADQRVIAAVTDQMTRTCLSTRFLNDITPKYIDALVATMPETEEGWAVFLVNSGSEANDLAFQIAREYTCQQGIVAIENCYHGITAAINELNDCNSTGVTATSSKVQTSKRAITTQLPENTADGIVNLSQAISRLEQSDQGFAAFVAETIQGVAGNIDMPKDYLKLAAELVRSSGGVVIADEVQTGFGRTGTFWGFEQEGFVPDIVTMGKPMGNGFPLGGLICRMDLADAITGVNLFSTFGGSPPAAAAGLAVVNAVHEDHLCQRSHELGQYMQDRLIDMVGQHPTKLDKVTGRGLFLGLHLQVPSGLSRHPTADAILHYCRDNGLITGLGGVKHNVLRFKPPMCVTVAEIDQCSKVVDQAIAKLA